MRSVLYIDDKEEELQAFEFQFSKQFRVLTCQNGLSAASIVRREKPEVVVLDLQLPGYDGYRVLADIRALPNPPPVLMLSGYDESFFVARALREGAAQFVPKPYFHAMLYRYIDMIIERRSIVSPVKKVAPSRRDMKARLIGSSALMRSVRDEIASYASSDLPVLIVGESGTGKELAASFIHEASSRALGPYEIVNIAAITESLVESELFGCEPGAFTDARSRSGCFESANGGTLFLDEIGDASATAQAALLRVVEDGVVRRIGGSRNRRIDCRLVCATNHDLHALIGERRFRSDLFYRLERLPLRMPPLREHREDIVELVEYFLFSQEDIPVEITEEALEKLVSYDWPGNVRQLKSCLDRAMLLSRGDRIEERHLRLSPFSA